MMQATMVCYKLEYLELENQLYEAWLRDELEDRFDIVGSPRSRGKLRRRSTARPITVAVANGLVSVAAKRNHVEIIKFLVDHGADVNLSESSEWPCPLNEACTRGHLQSVQTLVDLGAQPTNDLLQSALCNGFRDLAKYLVDKGVRIDATQAEATLGAVCTKGDLETVQYIVGVLKIKPTVFTFLGACLSKRSKVVLYLMTKGCGATAEVLGMGDVVVEAVGEALLERVKVVSDTAIAVWRKLSLAWVNFNWFFHPWVTAQYVEIDLSDNKLHDIPIQLFNGELLFLVTLRLHHNQFRHLPQLRASDLTESMEVESMSGTTDDTTSLDSQRGVNLSKLTDLDISYNDLRDIPQYIFELPHLKVLNVSHNWLRSLYPARTNSQDQDRLPSFESATSNSESQAVQITITIEDSLQQESIESSRDSQQTTESLSSRTTSSDFSPSAEPCAVKWKCVHLEKLDVSHNALDRLPDDIAQLPLLRKLRVHHNHLKDLPAVWQTCPNLEELDTRCNFITSSLNLLAKITEPLKTRLRYLDLSNNRLTEFPPEVCLMKALRCLLLSGNYIREIPRKLKWQNTCLERLDVAHNFLGSAIPQREKETLENTRRSVSPSPHPQPVSEVDNAHNERHPQRKRSRSESDLSLISITLDLQPNQGNVALPHRPPSGAISWSPRFEKKIKSPFFKAEGDPSALAQDDYLYLPAMLRDLKHVDISFNKFEDVPLCLCNLRSLAQLILVGNPGIERLPLELSWRTQLWQLDVEGLNISFPPHLLETRASRGTYLPVKTTLAYMSKLLRDEMPDYFIKVVIMGDAMSGKTCLSQALCDPQSLAKVAPYQPSPPGVIFHGATIYPKGAIRSTSSTSDAGLECCVWEITDPKVYNGLARTFFTRRTIHLLLWDVTRGENGVKSLREWLREIPNGDNSTSVLIVGTHDEEGDGQRCRVLTAAELQTGQYRAVTSAVRVSSTNSWRSIESLRDRIYKIGRLCCERLSKVPKAYSDMRREFKERLTKRLTMNSSRDGRVPFHATQESIRNVLAGIEAHIKWDREFVPAMQYLQEVGQLVHFEDPLENLSQFYFTDLEMVFAKIGTLVGQRITIETGTIEHNQAINMLCDDRLPADLLHTFLRLLERMGVAFPITDHSVIVPALLPAERPHLTPESSLHHTKSCISRTRTGSEGETFPYQLRNFKTVQRVYSLHIMPANFLCQLVARIVSSFDRWRSSRRRMTSGHRTRTGSFTEMPYLDANHDGRYRPRVGTAQAIDIKCWRYGMMAFYEEGYLVVESIDGLRRRRATLQLCGIQVTVAGDMSVLGFVIDQVETLLTDWFPEFSLAGLGGFQQLERIALNRVVASDIAAIPSTGTRQAIARSKPLAGSEEAHQFGLFIVEQCCVHWQVQDTIRCPETGQLIQLTDIIPDVLMEDVPREMHITAHELSFNPTKENFIGYGGEADVYLHTFRGTPVAVKVYHLSGAGCGSPSDIIGFESATVASRLFAMLTSSTESLQHIDAGLGARRSVPETAVKRSQAAMQPANILDDACSLALVSHGSTLLDIFRKMRREVTFLLQLRHPCVVPLVGFCVRPLCLLTEYAPVGSLSAALSTVRQAELKARAPNSPLEVTELPLFRDGVLGRALTWKIAFQVAHALHYLHHCRVVYHDLKSANVLLYSLDINTPINVKVADYGIAQYLSLSGVKEARALGTPGFQAPEVTQHRSRDRVFNEQADIFSFAMVLYELLTGHRPFAHSPFSALEVPEKISLGERPPLDSGYTIPRFVELLLESWSQEARDRPTAQEIIIEMKTDSFAVQHRTLPSPRFVALDHICPAVDNSAIPTNCLVDSRQEKIKAVLQASTEEKPTLTRQTDLLQSGVVWAIGGSGDERRLTVANAQTGKYHLKEASFPGPRVKCMASVAGRQMWLGVEQPGGMPELRVYSSPGAEIGFTWEFRWKSHLDETPCAVLSQKNTDSQTTQYCVLLSLSDGSMTAFYGQEHDRPEVREELHSCRRSSLDDWRRTRHERKAMHRDIRRRKEEKALTYLPLIKDDNFSWDRDSFRAVDVNDHPVTCMVPVGQDEVWCGAGSQICVLSRRGRLKEHLSRAEAIQLQGFRATHLVHLNATVWVTDDKQSYAWLYDVNTRRLTAVLDFGKLSLTTPFPCPVPSISHPPQRETDINKPGMSTSSSLHRLSSLEQRSSPTQAESKASATAFLSMELEPQGASSHLEAVLQRQPVSAPTSPVAVRQEDGDNMNNMNNMNNIRATAAVGDALWLGREGGDIIVVSGNSGADGLYLALGHLQPQRTSRLFGCPVQTLTPLSCGLVVVGRRPRSEGHFSLNLLPSRLYYNYFSANRPAYRSDDTVPLDIWEAWSSQEFNWFRQQQSHLG